MMRVLMNFLTHMAEIDVAYDALRHGWNDVILMNDRHDGHEDKMKLMIHLKQLPLPMTKTHSPVID